MILIIPRPADLWWMRLKVVPTLRNNRRDVRIARHPRDVDRAAEEVEAYLHLSRYAVADCAHSALVRPIAAEDPSRFRGMHDVGKPNRPAARLHLVNRRRCDAALSYRIGCAFCNAIVDEPLYHPLINTADLTPVALVLGSVEYTRCIDRVVVLINIGG